MNIFNTILIYILVNCTLSTSILCANFLSIYTGKPFWFAQMFPLSCASVFRLMHRPIAQMSSALP